jgi:hypothetical protein
MLTGGDFGTTAGTAVREAAALKQHSRAIKERIAVVRRDVVEAKSDQDSVQPLMPTVV